MQSFDSYNDIMQNIPETLYSITIIRTWAIKLF